MLGIKRNLIYIYGRSSDMFSARFLEKKIAFCEEIMTACDVVMPGNYFLHAKPILVVLLE